MFNRLHVAPSTYGTEPFVLVRYLNLESFDLLTIKCLKLLAARMENDLTNDSNAKL